MRLTRRHLLAGAAAVAALGPRRALGQAVSPVLNAADFGVIAEPGGGGADQSGAFRTAVRAAADARVPLFVPGGHYTLDTVELPSEVTITGVRGASVLHGLAADPIFAGAGAQQVTLRDIVFEGNRIALDAERPGLVNLMECSGVELDGIELRGGAVGIHLAGTSGLIENVLVRGIADTGIFALDSRNLTISRSRIFECGNGGIRVWAGATGGYDGTLVAHNDISDIRSDGGGNGQNGNGINVFRANGVIVTGNRLRNCAFSSVRLNTTEDTIVSNNSCLDSGEVAIFSEFAFSGSVIADNIVDRAAQGISITNFNEGGRLATCTGNVVRNIAPVSPVNPDTVPVGIFAEADAVVANNLVENVPGVGIGAGWGPYLRDVSIAGNVVREADIGIGVSVAEGAGAVLVSDNLVSGARRAAIAGLAWTEVVTEDLVRDAARFPLVTVEGNRIG